MKENQTAKNYDDIINLEHPTSAVHPRMSLEDRAAQFSPFAALTGHEDAIKETARLTDKAPELTEDAKADIAEKLSFLLQSPQNFPAAHITLFVPDIKKQGGSYVTYTGQIKRVDDAARTLIMSDRTALPLDEICEIEF